MSRPTPPGPARDIALDVLVACDVDGAYANLRLAAELAHAGLTARDAAFATELTFGTLRLRARYDAVIAACSSRPPADLDAVVLAALRLGCHQLLTLRTPSHAAVAATVTQIGRRAGRGAGGFGNAVLRAVSRRTWDQWRADLDLSVAVVDSHPEWIIRALESALRAQSAADELPALLACNNTAAPVTVVARPGRVDVADLLAQTEGTAGRWSPWAVRVTGDPGRFPAVRSGAAAVQDEGSQLMALAMSRLPAVAGDWLDLCAGPGGKTADLAGLAADAGARLVAVEQHAHRADLIRSTVGGGAPVEVITGDATTVDLLPAARILVDAPCTGLGALRRRPDLRWRRTPGDLPALRSAQRRLLDRALDLVLPGGCVAYVTCSPHLAETDDVVAAALRRHDDVTLVPAGTLLPEVPDAAVGDVVRLWPQRHDTDGMFLAVLRRAH